MASRDMRRFERVFGLDMMGMLGEYEMGMQYMIELSWLVYLILEWCYICEFKY